MRRGTAQPDSRTLELTIPPSLPLHADRVME
jgi:hypothetical protein